MRDVYIKTKHSEVPFKQIRAAYVLKLWHHFHRAFKADPVAVMWTGKQMGMTEGISSQQRLKYYTRGTDYSWMVNPALIRWVNMKSGRVGWKKHNPGA